MKKLIIEVISALLTGLTPFVAYYALLIEPFWRGGTFLSCVMFPTINLCCVYTIQLIKKAVINYLVEKGNVIDNENFS